MLPKIDTSWVVETAVAEVKSDVYKTYGKFRLWREEYCIIMTNDMLCLQNTVYPNLVGKGAVPVMCMDTGKGMLLFPE